MADQLIISGESAIIHTALKQRPDSVESCIVRYTTCGHMRVKNQQSWKVVGVKRLELLSQSVLLVLPLIDVTVTI
jgi:hypothetical protein